MTVNEQESGAAILAADEVDAAPVAGADIDTDAGTIELLRSYEPVLAYTKGEHFFPTGVEDYIRCCSLLRGTEQLVPAGELTVDGLVAAAEAQNSNMSLLFVQRPFTRRQVRRHRRFRKKTIETSGRLAAVGLVGRLVDVLLRVSLLLRGNVPGGVAAAAADRYTREMNPGRCRYYGRVVRDGGYVILQYWFFYAMNDWRTTFGGVNDHEADWEAVTVYLTETEDGLQPAWVAISAHDNTGDDLRRRWDDPDLRRSGDHPVIFVGAGSHSGAVVPGQYIVSVNPERARPFLRALNNVTSIVFPWTRKNKQHGVGVPYLDYALGNGEKIGPGGAREWEPALISDDTPWVRAFHGLWGRDPRDWLGGERAPAGPRYNRDGRVRELWADPLSWSGLQKLSPEREQAEQYLRTRLDDIAEQIETADAEIETGREELRRLRAIAVSLNNHANTAVLARDRFAEVTKAERALAEKVRVRTELVEEDAAHQATLAGQPAPESPQGHLRQPHLPHPQTRGSRAKFLRTWAALSTPLFILAMVGVFLVPDRPHFVPVASVILVFIAVESWARRRLRAVGSGLLIAAGVLGALVGLRYAVMYGGRYVVLAPFVIAAGVLLFVNLRDLYRK
ncbi:MAG: hypothetical protein ACRDOO_11780 [Actinomadura sp.]